MFLEDKNLMNEPAAKAALVEADPFSLESLVAWLEEQPGGTPYNFYDMGNCLWGLYVRANGGSYTYPLYTLAGACMSSEGQKMPPAHIRIAVDKPRTLGAALSRARALLSSKAEGRLP